jgi:DNA repair photolyase
MVTIIEQNQTGPAILFRREAPDPLFHAVGQVMPYAGCRYGCDYCDAWSFSDRPIDQEITAFVDLPERLGEELSAMPPPEGYIALNLGDSYQPVEQQFQLARRILQVLIEHKRPCLILTKSISVLHDLDLLREANRSSGVVVLSTVITLDDTLWRRLEGRAPSPEDRISLVHDLRQEGIPAGFALIPILPAITDSEDHLNRLLKAMATADPNFVLWEHLWLPNDRHRARILRLIGELDPALPSAYEKTFSDGPRPDEAYRRSIDDLIARQLDNLGIAAGMAARMENGVSIQPSPDSGLANQ